MGKGNFMFMKKFLVSILLHALIIVSYPIVGMELIGMELHHNTSDFQNDLQKSQFLKIENKDAFDEIIFADEHPRYNENTNTFCLHTLKPYGVLYVDGPEKKAPDISFGQILASKAHHFVMLEGCKGLKKKREFSWDVLSQSVVYVSDEQIMALDKVLDRKSLRLIYFLDNHLSLCNPVLCTSSYNKKHRMFCSYKSKLLSAFISSTLQDSDLKSP